MNSLNSTDPELLAAIVAIKKDDPGMRDKFEETIAFLAQCDPVACKRSNSKQPSAEISVATADRGSLKDGKFGTTGVEILWYKYKDFNALDEAKQEELRNWSATQPKKEAKKNRPGNSRANRGGKHGDNQQVKIQGASTPGSIKFKRVIAASVRAKITALEEASNTSSLTNNTRNINADTLVSAIISISAAAAKKDNAYIASIASETAIAQVLDKKDDLKVPELQL